MKSVFLFVCFCCYYLPASGNELDLSIAKIERQISGLVGVSVLDTGSGRHWNYRGDDRFPLMSTFKTLACANMFDDVAKGLVEPDVESLIEAEQLVVWSPVTEKLVGSKMTLFKACEATLLTSDNTAANVVLQHIGGPMGLTDFLRSVGDDVSRLDRIEPELNEAKAGDPQDTSTPNSMVNTLNKLLLGDVLPDRSREQLRLWMQNNTVSDKLLRSVLPKGWLIADRTGAGQNGSRGITALIWNDTRKPIIISIYLTQTELSFAERNQTVADIGVEIFKAYGVD